MAASRVGQKYPILFLIGPPGSGKSRLADRVSRVADSPVQLVHLRTTRPLGNDRDRRLFKRLAESDLEALRQTRGAIAFECETSRGHYAILRHTILEAAAKRVALMWGPSEAALRIRQLDFLAYVMHVRPLGRRGSEDATLDIGEEQPTPGLNIDEHYDNLFLPGGIQKGIEHVLATARRLHEPL